MERVETMKVALVQTAPAAGDVEVNLKMMEHFIRRSGRHGLGADWVVFPELFITGYVPDLWPHLPSPADEREWLARIQQMAEAAGVWVVCGHPSYGQPDGTSGEACEVDGGANGPLYNAVSIVAGSGVVGTYAKVHLFGREPETFVAGDAWPVWKTPWGRVAVQICYDLEFPEAARLAGLAGADLLICPSNNMHPFADFHRVFATARAMENNLFVVYSNRIGRELDIEFCGGSGVVDPLGRWLVEAGEDDGVFVAEIDLNQRKEMDPALQYRRYRRPELYGPIAERATML
jgi:predicted amidohydrolase